MSFQVKNNENHKEDIDFMKTHSAYCIVISKIQAFF